MSKLPAIFLNQDFFNKPRNRQWIMEHGAQALIVLQMVWLASSQEKECKIKKETCVFISYPFMLTREDVLRILESAVEVGLLESEDDYYYNSQIREDYENFQKKHNNYKKAREERERNKEESSEDSGRIQGESTNNSSRIVLNTDIDTEADIKIKKEKPKPEVLVFPEKLDNEPCRNAWNSWLEHKKSRGERYKSVQSQQQKLKEWAEKPEEFIEAINFSMGNNWAGIFPKREEKQQINAPNPQRKLSPTELSIQAAQRIMQRIENSKIGALDEK